MNDHHTASGERITGWTATQLARAIASREVSCREVMAATLAQVERLNPQVNALVSLRPACELLAEADARDAQLARGESMGWMHGFPQAPKDLASVAGLRSTQGSPIFRDEVPTVDTLAIARMRRAGSIFIGRSNTPEFGLGSHTYNTLHGLTRNAFDPSRSAGGSSGGAAVALALHMLPVADGSDMMGSLRNPAGWNDVYGMRPSFGRVPSVPAPDVFLQQFSTEGPMARSVEDLARLLAVQAGHDTRHPLSLDDDPSVFAQPLEAELRGLRIGWLGDLDGHLPMDDGVLAVCESALASLRTMGLQVEATSLGFDADRLWRAWLTLRGAMVASKLRPLYDDPARRAQLKPEAVWEVERGLRLDAASLVQASVDRSAWYQAALALFERFDLLALPTAQCFAFEASLDWPEAIAGRAMDTYHRWMEVVIPATMAGLPALAVPAGYGPGGLPMGLQLIGRPRGDLQLLQVGHGHDLATREARRPSPLLASGGRA